jgi:Undecaprenyl-phosphate glucose phosphotransferase
MTNRTSHPLAAWFLAADVGLTALAWLAAYGVRFAAFTSGLIPVKKEIPGLVAYVRTLPLIVVLAFVAFRMAGMYEVHRMRRFREELTAVARGVGLLALAVMAASFARQAHYESRPVMGLFTALTFAIVLLGRRLTWTAVRRLRSRGINQSHALIVGTGRLARRTARTLEALPWTGIRTVGFVEDDAGKVPTDLPVVGHIAELPRLVEAHHVEHVFIALPLNRYADARRVFDALSQTLVDVRLIADVPALSGLTLTTTNLHGMTVIGLRESPHYGLNVVVKRVMDIILSSLAIVLLAPLMAVVAVLVKLTSPGPMLYRQSRCGLNGRTFDMLKFRSMRADAEAQSGAVWAKENDPRRTRLGAFLRATNLDELPQLFNVLKGDMSLVGPRPERPEFVGEFSKSIPNYMARHAVKAGITGWAQVNGWRGNSSLRRRVQFDLYYITHWNPLFDIRILVLTVWRMLFQKQKHAY